MTVEEARRYLRLRNNMLDTAVRNRLSSGESKQEGRLHEMIVLLLSEYDRLKEENAAFGEFICRRCYLRQDPPSESEPPF